MKNTKKILTLTLSKSDRKEIGWDRDRWTGKWLLDLLLRETGHKISADEWDFDERDIIFNLPQQAVIQIVRKAKENNSTYPTLSSSLVSKFYRLYFQLTDHLINKLFP